MGEAGVTAGLPESDVATNRAPSARTAPLADLVTGRASAAATEERDSEDVFAAYEDVERPAREPNALDQIMTSASGRRAIPDGP